MFGSKSKQNEVLNHWIAFSEGFDISPLEFYERVEKELAILKIPGLAISREEFAEGGILSDKRIYLRMIRERLAFDACAAPFGTRFFFSHRAIYTPAVLKFWHIIVVIIFLNIISYPLGPLLGVNLAIVAYIGLIIALIATLHNVAVLKLTDLDTFLLKIPAIGPIYERFFRKETYYRFDTRLLYLQTVSELIQKLAEEVTAAKGVKLVRQYQRAPILGELYKPILPEKK